MTIWAFLILVNSVMVGHSDQAACEQLRAQIAQETEVTPSCVPMILLDPRKSKSS